MSWRAATRDGAGTAPATPSGKEKKTMMIVSIKTEALDQIDKMVKEGAFEKSRQYKYRPTHENNNINNRVVAAHFECEEPLSAFAVAPDIPIESIEQVTLRKLFSANTRKQGRFEDGNTVLTALEERREQAISVEVKGATIAPVLDIYKRYLDGRLDDKLIESYEPPQPDKPQKKHDWVSYFFTAFAMLAIPGALWLLMHRGSNDAKPKSSTIVAIRDYDVVEYGNGDMMLRFKRFGGWDIDVKPTNITILQTDRIQGTSIIFRDRDHCDLLVKEAQDAEKWRYYIQDLRRRYYEPRNVLPKDLP
jgi:hypothetical protein